MKGGELVHEDLGKTGVAERGLRRDGAGGEMKDILAGPERVKVIRGFRAEQGWQLGARP